MRVVTLNEAPWFVLADVCAVLEIANPRDAATRLDDDEKDVDIPDILDGPQEIWSSRSPASTRCCRPTASRGRSDLIGGCVTRCYRNSAPYRAEPIRHVSVHVFSERGRSVEIYY